MADIVTLESVRLTLGGFEALRGVSVAFAEGESTVIMGPSGCGKSTLLKVAAGLIPPDSGKVCYQGRDFYNMSERALMDIRRQNGFIFQDGALWENKTLFENLALPLQVHFPEVSAMERNRRVIQALERVGLEESATERPAALSGGEKKLAAFVRALMTEPGLLFMDEPTLSVDHATTERINQIIRDQKGRGSSIIAVTHDAQLTSTLADRLVVMDEGQILATGYFDEVRHSTHPRVRAILSEVLNNIASYDTDLLELLDQDHNPGKQH
jgi:ABC-type transporter Mla maintaining outer membrane lipid asymmetry ATPase subunit MlaF